MPSKLILVPAALLLAAFALPAQAQVSSTVPAETTTTATTSTAATVQFFNFDTNQYQSTFPWGQTPEIVLSLAGVQDRLPIDLELRVNDEIVWEGQITDPSQQCRDSDTCSTRGPILADPGQVPIEIVALNLQGTTIAVYKERQESRKTETVAEPVTPGSSPVEVAPTVPSAPTVQVPDSGWYTWWWLGGFWIGIAWIFLWLFIGLQWVRRHFWGWGWPWPWWFWLPWLWFIPWLLVGWFWWLDWWLWWMWLWWLFPSFFWLFWWLIVFKEAMVGMWRRRKEQGPPLP